MTIAVAPAARGSVSGSLFVASVNQTDSDTNDILLSPQANSTFAQAQAIPSPVLLGGYVAVPMAGRAGPLQVSGDVTDVYRVNLIKDQVIEVTVANPAPATNDVDLQLYSSAQVLLDTSAGVSRTERIIVPATGAYFVRVFAFSGSSNYLLSIGQTGSASSLSAAATLSDEFVPGQVLLKIGSKGTGVSGSSAKGRDALATMLGSGMEIVGGEDDRELLVELPSADESGAVRALHQADGHSPPEDEFPITFASDHERRKFETLMAIKALSSRADVEWVQPNYYRHAQAVPNDPLYGRQRWHYELISLPAAWDVTTGSANTIVAVVDSGVRPHSELGPKLVFGMDFVRGTNSGDGDGIDVDASDPGIVRQGSFSFHGTHVAGTIGAVSNEGFGVAGVSWGTRIMPVRALGINNSGTDADILQAIRYAAGLANDSGRVPGQRADVVNLSLGAQGGCPSAWQSVISAARSAGVVVVASAGNDNVSGQYTPAGCDGVISVSSVDAARSKAPYSNFGAGVDVAAPGGDRSADRNGDALPDGIYSTHAQRTATGYLSSYDLMEGTSMAAPHVSGVIALMRAVNPALTPAQIDSLLSSGALTDDIGPTGPDILGVGLINALKAVRSAVSGGAPTRPAQLVATPSSVSFGPVLTTFDVALSNAGTSPLTVQSTAVSASWLTVTPLGASGALGGFRITVSRTGLAVGVYSGWVEFRGSTGSAVRTSIVMEVRSSAVLPDAGQHYLLLTDPVTGNTVQQVEVYARGSAVSFSFANVPFGSYNLVAGTDLNNDGIICDDGEACGEYPVFSRAGVVVVDGNESGLDFATGYRTGSAPLGAQQAGSDKRAGEREGYARLR